jgi:hypothetical protein
MIGLGRMGENMVLRLMKVGHDLRVYSARPSTAQQWSAKALLEIDNDVALRLGAADQRIAGRRWIDWVGLVDDCPLYKPGFTSVTDSRAARPPRGDVARFGKLKEAPKRRTPMDIQATPSKRNQRSRTGRPSGRVRRPSRRGGDAWGNGWTWAEQLGMDTACSDSPGDEARGQITYEGRWPADEEGGIAWYF